MNLFKQFTRRAAVLLRCLSMVTGLVLPAFAATSPATETPVPTPATSFKFSNGTITEHIGDETDIVIPGNISVPKLISSVTARSIASALSHVL